MEDCVNRIQSSSSNAHPSQSNGKHETNGHYAKKLDYYEKRPQRSTSNEPKSSHWEKVYAPTKLTFNYDDLCDRLDNLEVVSNEHEDLFRLADQIKQITVGCSEKELYQNSYTVEKCIEKKVSTGIKFFTPLFSCRQKPTSGLSNAEKNVLKIGQSISWAIWFASIHALKSSTDSATIMSHLQVANNLPNSMITTMLSSSHQRKSI